jgi:hypothetical protein
MPERTVVDRRRFEAFREGRATLAESAVAALFWLWVAWPWLRLDRYVIGFDTLAWTGSSAVQATSATPRPERSIR